MKDLKTQIDLQSQVSDAISEQTGLMITNQSDSFSNDVQSQSFIQVIGLNSGHNSELNIESLQYIIDIGRPTLTMK